MREHLIKRAIQSDIRYTTHVWPACEGRGLGLLAIKQRKARLMLKQPQTYQDLQDPQARPRYTGIASFFRAPIAQQTAEVDIGIIGVPFDGGVTHRSGTRHGPRAVRDQSTLLRRINGATHVAPFATARVRDLGDCWLEFPYELAGALEEIAAYYRQIHAGGAVPVSVGGDHSISLPILRG